MPKTIGIRTKRDAVPPDIGVDGVDTVIADGLSGNVDPESATDQPRRNPTAYRTALSLGLMFVLALGALTGWLGFRVYENHQQTEQRARFVEAGRMGAVNLTTIDWHHADADIERILNSATGEFYEDFAKRSGPFIDVVKQAQSTSEGSIIEAGLESTTGNEAAVLVSVSVKTSNAGIPEGSQRAWRMRMTVQSVGDEMKVSNVEFVP